MSTLIYTSNYKRNLKLYWQQYYPQWEIPNGYHVHHIKPKCLFKKDDLSAHHPSNLIALHPDDHAAVHLLRGDKWANGVILSIKNRIVSNETKRKISDSKHQIQENGLTLAQNAAAKAAQTMKKFGIDKERFESGIRTKQQNKLKDPHKYSKAAKKGAKKLEVVEANGLTRRQNINKNSGSSGYVWVTNGEESKSVHPDCIPDGFRLGRILNSNKNKKLVCDVTNNKNIYVCPEDAKNYSPPINRTSGTKGKVKVYNIETDTIHYIDESISTKEKYTTKIPPHKITRRSMRWITDGKDNKMIAKDDELPNGYYPGRSHWIKNDRMDFQSE